MQENLDQLAINTLRILSAEMISKAKSGHPGLPLGAAPMAFVLYKYHMKFNSKNPDWCDRDRFILSAGHGSALLYALLFMFGYDLDLKDLKAFRQINSKTPGHPEYKKTPGVEVSTGPLGQGIANAVGMAIAESYLAKKFNRDDFKIIDHYVYVLCGDGCLMEGISHEAISLAGTLGLNKLIILYDSNNITIEGNIKNYFQEDILEKCKACGWHTQYVNDGNNINLINHAIKNAKENLSQPSIIEIKTIIGYGVSNKQGTELAHGEALSQEEINNLKKNLGWKYKNNFFVPEEVINYINKTNFVDHELKWQEEFDKYKNKYFDLASKFKTWQENKFDLDLDEFLIEKYKTQDMSTREASGIILNKICEKIENLIGGSADLAPSTKTVMFNHKFYSREDRDGANLHFGIREHAMAGIANGIVLHGGLKVYIASFFVFSDYMKPALRLASLMNLPVINIFTHDSIGVGEDGPTHQPIEQLAALRSMPNFIVLRPCDYTETLGAWNYALNNKNPTGIILSRQKLFNTGKTDINKIHRGAYILEDSNDFKIILIASGSEIYLAHEVYKKLKQIKINARLVSMISFELFDKQDKKYKNLILPDQVRTRIAIEAACEFGWHKYTGLDGEIISINTFGESGPGEILFDKFNLTVEKIFEQVKKIIL